MKKRVAEYDFLRVVLTLLVVLGHAARTAEATPLGGVDWVPAESVAPLYFSIDAVMQWLAAFVYRFHMPVFIALSGAVYALSGRERPFDALAADKARRLVLPFFAAGLLFMLPVKLWARFYSVAALREVVLGFLMGTESGHLWFLPALFWCFLLFWPIRRFVAEKSPLGGLCVAVLAGQLLSLLDMPYFELQRGFSCLGWFAAGFCFARYRHHLDAFIRRKTGAAAACFTALAAVLACNAVVTFLPGVFVVALSGLSLYFLAGFFALRQKAGQGRVFGLLLSYAFPIYLFHDPIEYAILRVAFETSLLQSVAGVAAYYLARTVGVVVGGIVLGWLVRQVVRLARGRRVAAA